VADELGVLLSAVATGRFPPADGRVRVVPQPSLRDAGVLSLTAHAVIFTDADPDWVTSLLPAGDLAAPLSPPFLQALCRATNRRAGSVDLLCLAQPLAREPAIAVTPCTDLAHPRISRALKYRDDVMAWQADGGVVLLGRGVAGRWEAAVEVDPEHRGRGLGRQLVTAARHLVPGKSPLWAQIAPGNAASVRAFLAAGFTPVGAEVLLAPANRPD
jgi:GNAT superfamily N-acetyltransferase